MATKNSRKFVAAREAAGTMGDWCKRKLEKGQRRSFTRSSPGRLYIAIPPETGWQGGAPEANGYRRSAGK